MVLERKCMSISGWVSIHRKIVEWQWYADTNVYRVFTHLIFTASHKDTEWCGIAIKEGQKITSYGNIATEIGALSVQQVRTALNKLKSTGEITIKTTNRYTVITINKYKDYQGVNRQPNKQITNNQQTNNKQITTFNNDNNDNKDISSSSKKAKKSFLKEYPGSLPVPLAPSLRNSPPLDFETISPLESEPGSLAPKELKPKSETESEPSTEFIDLPAPSLPLYTALCSLKPCTRKTFLKYYPEWISKAAVDELLHMVRDLATWYEGKGKKCGNSILAFNNWLSSPYRKEKSRDMSTIGSLSPYTMSYIYENTLIDEIDDYAKANSYHKGRIQEYCLYGGHRESWAPPLHTPEKFVTKFKERIEGK